MSLNSNQQNRIDVNIQKKIDDFVKRFYPKNEVCGSLSLSIVQDNGELLYSTGYGFANVEKRLPANGDTQFCVGSITKSITALMAVKLLNEKFPQLGESVLDTPIKALLPEADFALIDKFRTENVTMRDLLAHRLCLLNDDLHLDADPFDSPEEVAFRHRYNKETCGFRTQFHYSNPGYVMVGELIRLLAKKSYEEVIQDFLDELNMKDSAFGQRDDNYSEGLSNRARPYYFLDNEVHPLNTDLLKRVLNHNAAGGLFSTANDMVKYMQFLLNGRNVKGKEIVPVDVMKWIFKPSTLIPATSFKTADSDKGLLSTFAYGLGCKLGSLDGWEYNQHSGYVNPYRSLVSLFPGKNLAIFSSSTMSPTFVDALVLHAFIFETLLNDGKTTEISNKIKMQSFAFQQILRKNGEKDFKEFIEKWLQEKASPVEDGDCITGSYGNGSAGVVLISQRLNEKSNKTEYFLEYGKWFHGWLEEIINGNGIIYKVKFVTDIIQDSYSMGKKEGISYVAFDKGNKSLVIFQQNSAGSLMTYSYSQQVNLDNLPKIPWAITDN